MNTHESIWVVIYGSVNSYMGSIIMFQYMVVSQKKYETVILPLIFMEHHNF